MLGLTGFVKRKLEDMGKLPSKWKDDASDSGVVTSSLITYNAETNMLTLAAGTYTDYKGREKVLTEPITTGLRVDNPTMWVSSGAFSEGTYSIWISWSNKWAAGYGLQIDEVLSEDYDGNTISGPMGRTPTAAFKIGECTNLDENDYLNESEINCGYQVKGFKITYTDK
jgi:hypothetical protein